MQPRRNWTRDDSRGLSERTVTAPVPAAITEPDIIELQPLQTMFANEQTIHEITRRLVDFYHPVRVYLFGSVARGDNGPDSALDFCVVVPDNAPGDIFRAGASRPALAGISVAADVVPWRRTDFEQRAEAVKASLPATVIREGRILYESE